MKVEITNCGNYYSSVIDKEISEEQYKFLNDIINEINESGNKFSPKLNIYKLDENKLEDKIRWVNMETLESPCYNCCLYNSKTNKCENVNLCKHPKSIGFYVLKDIFKDHATN